MAQKPTLRPFKVKTTPKIRDTAGNYVKRGQMAMLSKEHANGYQQLGYIEVSMEHLFDEANQRSESARDSDAGTRDDSAAGIDNSASGEPDEGGTGAEAEADTGAGEAEDTAEPRAKRQRGRTAR